MKYIIGIVTLAALLVLAACGDGGDGPAPPPEPTSTMVPPSATPIPTPTPEPDRVQLLEDFFQKRGDAVVKQEWALLYAYQPKAFNANCDLADFVGGLIVYWSLIGLPDGLVYVVDAVRADGDIGWAEGHFEKDGLTIETGLEDDDGDDDPGDHDAVWQDGKWQLYMTDEQIAEGCGNEE